MPQAGLLWLLVFGRALSGARGRGVEGVPYRASYLVPGALVQSVSVAVSSGLAMRSPPCPRPWPFRRRVLLVGVGPDRLLLDVGVLVGCTIVAVAIATRTFPRRVM